MSDHTRPDFMENLFFFFFDYLMPGNAENCSRGYAKGRHGEVFYYCTVFLVIPALSPFLYVPRVCPIPNMRNSLSEIPFSSSPHFNGVKNGNIFDVRLFRIARSLYPDFSLRELKRFIAGSVVKGVICVLSSQVTFICYFLLLTSFFLAKMFLVYYLVYSLKVAFYRLRGGNNHYIIYDT